MAKLAFDIDFPGLDELPTLRFEVRDEILRQVRSGEAVYRGLNPEDAESHHHARLRILNELRHRILRAVARERERARASASPAPVHTCLYWRTRDGVCSMCGAVLWNGE